MPRSISAGGVVGDSRESILATLGNALDEIHADATEDGVQPKWDDLNIQCEQTANGTYMHVTVQWRDS